VGVVAAADVQMREEKKKGMMEKNIR